MAQTFTGLEAEQRVSGCVSLHYSKSSDFPAFAKFSDKGMLASSDFGTWLVRTFKAGSKSEFRKIRSEKDDLGFVHHIYQYYYNGFPVEGALVKAHEHKGNIQSFNGNVILIREKEFNSSLSESQALSKALLAINATKYSWQDEKAEAHLKRITHNPEASAYPKGEMRIVYSVKQNTPVLTYKFDVYAVEPLSRYYIFVDAETGNVVYKENRIRSCFHHAHDEHLESHPDEVEVVAQSTANATGTAVTRYSGSQSITTETYLSGYRLRETSRGDGIETYNMQNGTSYSSAVDFTDSDNNWPSGTHAPAYDAHWGAAATYDYYFSTFGRDSYDNQGSKMISYVHFGSDYDNAFWDGSSMTYGDGSNVTGGFKPLTCLDVVGHEFTHGVTEYSAQLQYSGESGALNESFSDIFGTVIEYYKKPSTGNFLIGDQITVGASALRSMSNPNAFDQPDTYEGTLWDPFEEVHTNSGVGNYWFYLVCQGGTGNNDNSDSYSVSGIGITKAARIAYRALTVYLTPTSNYADARFFTMLAAADLYGACSPEVQSVANAWYAVGVGTAYSSAVTADFSADQTSLCSVPAEVNFTNLSNNAASYSWDFGDGGTSTLSAPTHNYAANGTYTVTLTIGGGACGGNDTETKTSYIVVNTSGVCSLNLPTSGVGPTQTSCNGVVKDNGGNNDYAGNADGSVVIAPNGASSVTLTFTSFDLEDGYDYLKIYDGSSISSPLIGSYTGSNLPDGGVINSTGGAITLRLVTDELVVGAGFVCNWTCSLPTNPPTVNFIALPVFSCDGEVSFVDKSTNAPNSWTWDFGDGSPTSTSQNPAHTYASSGTYTVKLTSCNGIGCGTMLTKTNYVTIDKASTACNVNSMPSSGNASLITSCGGTLYDSGGNSSYQAGTNGIQTIKPTGSSSVTLNFSSFEFESGYDYLYIYDGESIASPLIGAYSGYNLPEGGTITSSGGAITLKQTTDNSVNYSGFICDWSCTLPTSAPVADFVASTSVSCTGEVTFTDRSTEGPDSWAWDFGDGNTSTLKNPTHTYASNGWYTIKLTACNSFGCGVQLVQTNYIKIAKPCTEIKMKQIGTSTTQTACAGVLKDSGGNSNYQNDSHSFITIAPTGATKVILQFLEFNFEEGYDYLVVYDGPNTSSDVIGEFTGYTLPLDGIVMSTGNSLTLEQYSDGIYTDTGFKLNWSCSVVSTEDAVANQVSISLYPNPTQGDLNVNYKFNGTKSLKSSLYNSMGVEVYQSSGVYTSEYASKLSTKELSKGLYIWSVTDENGATYSSRLVIE